MRYDSIERLRAWQLRGAFPQIHADIAGIIQAYVRGDRMLDLCCSYGLLGQRLMATGATKVCGIESESDTVAAARSAGIAVDILELNIARETLPAVVALITTNALTVVVARRCIPELFPHDPQWAIDFAAAINAAGIMEIVLEGRAPVARPAHRIPTVEAEVACFAGSYREVRRIGQCSYLVAK